jgi:3-oxoacyl-[acyl-carrier protein] reductase
MTPKLAGKVAVVTGASKGIGAAIATHLAAAGAAVVVNYSSSKEGADRIVAEIKKNGGKAVAVQANMAKKPDIERLFAETKKAFDKLDILVNNAGVYEFFPIENTTEENYRRMFDLNVLGLLLASKEAAKHFGKEGGSIINISSVAATAAPPTMSVYSATKGAVNSITRSLAQELGARKIRVNSLSPGPVNTEGTSDFFKEGSEMAKQMIAQTPLGRVGEPDDIAAVAVFLASPDSRWITGETIRVAGGLV